jgi:hypothetical protein
VTQTQTTQTRIPNPYFDYENNELDLRRLNNHIREALEKAEQLIRKGKPSLNDIKKIVEEKVREKLGQAIEYVEYYFDEGVYWDTFEVVDDVEIDRVYDSIDSLTITFVDGPEVGFYVQADYVVIREKDKESVIYFKINDVELISVRW